MSKPFNNPFHELNKKLDFAKKHTKLENSQAKDLGFYKAKKMKKSA